MAELRSEDVLMGMIALAMVPWIGWILNRGVRERWLPIGKSAVLADRRPGAFRALFACYLAAAGLMAYIGADLALLPVVRSFS